MRQFRLQLLGGIADTIAQNISMARGRSAKAEDVADGVSHVTEGRQASSFDYTRLFRFVGYGLFMTPIQLKWYTLLSRWFPLEAKRPTLSAVKRVTFDQLAFAPVGKIRHIMFAMQKWEEDRNKDDAD